MMNRRLKAIRQLAGLTQKRFSEQYHIPLRTIENWECSSESLRHRSCPVYVVELLKKAVETDYTERYQAGRMAVRSVGLEDSDDKLYEYIADGTVTFRRTQRGYEVVVVTVSSGMVVFRTDTMQMLDDDDEETLKKSTRRAV